MCTFIKQNIEAAEIQSQMSAVLAIGMHRIQAITIGESGSPIPESFHHLA
jgi:hypothetical protein